jgi:serine/threonine protein kinase
MTAEVRCTNPMCGRPSRLGTDELGRTFRCAKCGTKLPRSAGSGSKPPTRQRPAPWEREERTASCGAGRSLGAATPARLGRFQVCSVLGTGAHATVYRAFDTELEREVALKVPHAWALAGPRAMTRFLGEARAMARLQHPSIVPVFEAGRFGDLPYLATAYVPGRPLSHVLEDGPVGPARAAAIAAALAEALGYAHDAGVVHRDVKPANVLVDPTGAVHLMDFGLACHEGVPDRPGGGGGLLVGTPAYLAPEQTSDGVSDASPASDQYSVGVVLFEMLTGRAPFLGPPALVVYYSRFDAPTRPRELRPGIPGALERICLKAMARRPSDRYPTCQALAADLRRWLRRNRAADAPSPRPLGKAVAWLRDRPGASVSAALALIGLVTSTALASTLLTLRPGHDDPRPAPDTPRVVNTAPARTPSR